MLAINAGVALDGRTQAIYCSLWLEGLGDLTYSVLEAAFLKALRTCKFWPVKVADIREAVDRTRETALSQAADLEWQNLLDYIQKWINPDFQIKRHRAGCPRMVCDCPGPPRLSERVDRAARSAGGLFYLRECSNEDLQWAKKRFVESYIAWEELGREQFVLPDGELKNLIAGCAEIKALPPSQVSFEELHARGLRYAEKIKTAEPQGKPRKNFPVRPSLLSIDEQKKVLHEKGFL